MHPIMIICEFAFLCIGAFFLFKSLSAIKRLILELPDGSLKKRWKVINNLILFFLVGYVLAGYNLWIVKEQLSILSLLISTMLFLGGIFSYLVGQLALQTTNDVKNLTILQHESITDSLTGLRNRRYFDQRICEEVALSKRYKLPLSLMLLDVDYFKRINDTYGHAVGDEVLRNISNIVMDVVRDSDIVARYGGEEIVIITPSTTKEEAELLAERLRGMIEKTTVATVGPMQDLVQVTASIGICSLSAVITDKDALIEETDQALYMAKKYGRNKVIVSNW